MTFGYDFFLKYSSAYVNDSTSVAAITLRQWTTFLSGYDFVILSNRLLVVVDHFVLLTNILRRCPPRVLIGFVLYS